MKKILSVILSAMVVMGMMAFNVGAASQAEPQLNVISEKVEYFDDGSSVVVTVYEYAASNGRATTTKSGIKTYTAKNNNGEVIWKFKVHGSFSVNTGVSATCTSASYSVSDLGSGWSLKTATASRSGNKAIANGTFELKVLSIVVRDEDCSVTLQCDKNGNLS